MAQLRIRKLAPELIRALKLRANQNGRRLEEEVLAIFQAAFERDEEEAAAAGAQITLKGRVTP